MNPPPSIGPDAVANAMIALVASAMLVYIVLGVIASARTKNEQRLLSAVAWPEGLWIGAGISPDGRIAAVMTRSFEIVPSTYRVAVLTFLGLSTIALLILGALRMWESGSWLAVIGFFLVFFGAIGLSSAAPMVGFVAIVMGFFLTEIAPSRSRWGAR